MNPSRRRLLFGLAAFAASTSPAIARASSLMKVKPPTLILYGDGSHDDTVALQALMDGKSVFWDAAWEQPFGIYGLKPAPRWERRVALPDRVIVPSGVYMTSDTLRMPEGKSLEAHQMCLISAMTEPDKPGISVAPISDTTYVDIRHLLGHDRDGFEPYSALIRVEQEVGANHTYDIPRKVRMSQLSLRPPHPTGEVAVPLPAVGERLREDD